MNSQNFEQKLQPYSNGLNYKSQSITIDSSQTHNLYGSNMNKQKQTSLERILKTIKQTNNKEIEQVMTNDDSDFGDRIKSENNKNLQLSTSKNNIKRQQISQEFPLQKNIYSQIPKQKKVYNHHHQKKRTKTTVIFKTLDNINHNGQISPFENQDNMPFNKQIEKDYENSIRQDTANNKLARSNSFQIKNKGYVKLRSIIRANDQDSEMKLQDLIDIENMKSNLQFDKNNQKSNDNLQALDFSPQRDQSRNSNHNSNINQATQFSRKREFSLQFSSNINFGTVNIPNDYSIQQKIPNNFMNSQFQESNILQPYQNLKIAEPSNQTIQEKQNQPFRYKIKKKIQKYQPKAIQPDGIEEKELAAHQYGLNGMKEEKNYTLENNKSTSSKLRKKSRQVLLVQTIYGVGEYSNNKVGQSNSSAKNSNNNSYKNSMQDMFTQKKTFKNLKSSKSSKKLLKSTNQTHKKSIQSLFQNIQQTPAQIENQNQFSQNPQASSFIQNNNSKPPTNQQYFNINPPNIMSKQSSLHFRSQSKDHQSSLSYQNSKQNQPFTYQASNLSIIPEKIKNYNLQTTNSLKKDSTQTENLNNLIIGFNSQIDVSKENEQKRLNFEDENKFIKDIQSDSQDHAKDSNRRKLQNKLPPTIQRVKQDSEKHDINSSKSFGQMLEDHKVMNKDQDTESNPQTQSITKLDILKQRFKSLQRNHSQQKPRQITPQILNQNLSNNNVPVIMKIRNSNSSSGVKRIQQSQNNQVQSKINASKNERNIDEKQKPEGNLFDDPDMIQFKKENQNPNYLQFYEAPRKQERQELNREVHIRNSFLDESSIHEIPLNDENLQENIQQSQISQNNQQQQYLRFNVKEALKQMNSRPPKSPSYLLEGFKYNQFLKYYFMYQIQSKNGSLQILFQGIDKKNINMIEKFLPNVKIPISKKTINENNVEDMQLRNLLQIMEDKFN